MATTISVNKQTIEQFLLNARTKPFLIPEYQRPYSWTSDQIDTLFNDIWEFTCNEGGTDKEGTYFLGSIVSYENDRGEQEIIDGQQRITSIFLLLRAIYTKLNGVEEKTEEAKNFISKIEPLIWSTNKLTGKVDYSSILLNSKVISETENQTLKNILESGEIDKESEDNYSKNYNQILKLIEEKSVENALMIYQFIYALLNQVIILPITADSQETALTIFSTLNDRGLPLSDADIFKAKIYNHLKSKEEKEEFIEKWKELEEDTQDISESIQQLFYYYMFYLRALENDRNSTTPGLRKYYSANKFKKLLEADILDDLRKILNIWKVIDDYSKNRIENESWSENKDILKVLDILTSYPNEFWKYPVIVYYLSHKDKKEFEIKFLKFLRKLYVELLKKYIEIPTINAVKANILKLNAEIINSDKPIFDFKALPEDEIKEKIKTPHRNAVRMLLKTLTYDIQDNLLEKKWEIEHILPVKWENNYDLRENEKVAKEKIEHLGNKTPFEKKLNIIATNNYFSKKKILYLNSEIKITKEIGELKSNKWDLDDIIERDIRMTDKIISILKLWNKEYK
ncbi:MULTISPECIES: DUF262 domain-containing protein [Fusobacterium]|jgi:hypothetical protein|uniref:DUF262 domain-containing protein n=1 Tax=Fusobacterium nucleatum TaxID=851 RepID=A0A323TSM2_FUSNU|nr:MULTISPECIES: DUF262 domain-containing protein [Fusobacterium]PCR84990.1 hypothetical protein CQA79_06845 [Fusobacterium nucleatum]PZA03581.1 DUF262 domain-containing protein [Fusobacterium nucleatum]QJX51119.1 DUF262 domain-containing protein [Fusobacterium nucleatum]HCE31894.1 DUF262 domain-containing protein [Fusobacterium sp.]